jgi:hypothetical protein
VYKYERLRQQIDRFAETAAASDREYSVSLEEIFDNLGVVKSNAYALDTTGKDLSKAAALPNFGSKRDQLAAARQYVEGVIKPNPSLNQMYSIFPGYRTQQSEPGSEKVRLINMVPISTWIMELEAYRSTIDATVQECKSKEHLYSFFYTDPRTLFERFVSKIADANQAVVMDSTQYDSTVQEPELRAVSNALASDYPYIGLLADYLVHASIIMPDGDIARRGGVPSGSVITNILDGITNIADLQEAFERVGLWKWLSSIVVNGDDICLLFKTKIDKKNIDKVSRYSRRELNPDKSDLRQSTAWFSKLYLDSTLEGPCKPGFLVLNSLMFKEHQLDPVTGSKEYVAIATAQQVSYLEHHPDGSYIAQAVKSVDKYPVDKFTDQELDDAADRYLDDHSWMVEHGQIDGKSEFIKSLKTGFYAKT